MSGPLFLPIRTAEQAWLIQADEVLDIRAMTIDAVVPGCPSFLPGLVAHRGRLIAIARLGTLLGERGAAPCHRLVVVRHETDPVALAVTEVDAATSLTSPVDTDLPWDLSDEVALLARGTTRLPGATEATALVLDPASLHRFVRSACYKFWQKAPPPGCTFPAPGGA